MSDDATMIERVAKALCARDNQEIGEELEWSRFSEASRESWRAAARAAIAAMCEPTEAMVDVAPMAERLARVTWRAMIDAALAGQ